MTTTNDLLVLGIGVSPCKTDGVLRFEHFCRLFNISYKILGDGKIWHGGDMSAGAGGGQKINEVLEAIENMDNRLIILCDTFDIFILASKEEIIEKFNKLCDKDHVLFSSEVFCWPEKSLAQHYPEVQTKYKYLNSGCIMGYRDNIYNLIKNGEVKNNDDDQLFFTRKFLSGEKIILDYKCELFQALNGSVQDMVIHKNRIFNKYTNSYPIFIHGNGPAKLFLNHLENYIESDPKPNYIVPIRPQTNLLSDKKFVFPKVFVALYIDSSKNQEYELFMNSVADIDYKNKDVWVYDKNYNNQTKEFINLVGFKYQDNQQKYVFDDFKSTECDYYFLLEQKCIITNKNILHELVPHCAGYYRVIAPLLQNKDSRYFTNFWGDLDGNGYYARSSDYMSLVDGNTRGLWNVPYVSAAIVMDRSIIVDWDLSADNKFKVDNDMHLCCNLRKYTLFMYMANFNHYGYLV